MFYLYCLTVVCAFASYFVWNISFKGLNWADFEVQAWERKFGKVWAPEHFL